MRVTQLDDDVLRSLSEVETDEPVVVSVFIDLDPFQFATAAARESQVNSLPSLLRQRIREGELSDDAREALRSSRSASSASRSRTSTSPGRGARVLFQPCARRRHLEAVTDRLFRHPKRRPFEHLVIGANNESLRPALTGEAHSYLLGRVRGWIDLDEDTASEEDRRPGRP